MDFLNANLDPKRLTKCFGHSVGHSELLSQIHPNNQECEMMFDEFLECLTRCAVCLGERPHVSEVLQMWGLEFRRGSNAEGQSLEQQLIVQRVKICNVGQNWFGCKSVRMYLVWFCVCNTDAACEWVCMNVDIAAGATDARALHVELENFIANEYLMKMANLYPSRLWLNTWEEHSVLYIENGLCFPVWYWYCDSPCVSDDLQDRLRVDHRTEHVVLG